MFQGSDRLYRTTKKVFSVVECSDCALIRLLPRPTPDELKAYYPTQYWWRPDETLLGRSMELYRRIAIWDHVRFIVSSPILPGQILDVGSGGGVLVQALRRRGLLATGLDSSRIAARMTGLGGFPSVCAALPNIPFAAQSFAAITMLHILEHVTDPAACLSAARQLLQPGGRLFVQVPNAASWQFLLFGQRWSALDIPRHLVHFSANDLKGLLETCGFRVVRWKFFFWRDNPTSFATSLFAAWEPTVRFTRETNESMVYSVFKSILYFGVTILSLPFALWEAAAKAGSTVLVEAVLVEDR